MLALLFNDVNDDSGSMDPIRDDVNSDSGGMDRIHDCFLGVIRYPTFFIPWIVVLYHGPLLQILWKAP